MSDELTPADGEPTEGFSLEGEEESNELCSMLQVMYHFHVEKDDNAEAILQVFLDAALKQVNEVLDKLVEETPGILYGPENPRRYGINSPEDMELSEEDIRQLLNPQGGDS